MATDQDYRTEYLDLIISARVVDSLDEAIEHIANYSSHHTETIITNDLTASRRFVAAVDSSAVMVNASTRFNDGGELAWEPRSGSAPTSSTPAARADWSSSPVTSTSFTEMDKSEVRCRLSFRVAFRSAKGDKDFMFYGSFASALALHSSHLLIRL